MDRYQYADIYLTSYNIKNLLVMIWKKKIYDSLTECTTLCSEFATECSNSNNVENWYRSIFLSLDCADMCRNLAILYVRGSEKVHLLARACIEICKECAQEVIKFNSERTRQVYEMCQQTIYSCVNIIEMGY